MMSPGGTGLLNKSVPICTEGLTIGAAVRRKHLYEVKHLLEILSNKILPKLCISRGKMNKLN